jgi:hypothetical protein
MVFIILQRNCWNLPGVPTGGTPGKFQRGILIVLHPLSFYKEY